MTGKFKVGEMVFLHNDRRKLMDRRNEGRVSEICKSFYLVQKMSNGKVNSYYEKYLVPISKQIEV